MKINKIGFVVSYYSPNYVRAITLQKALRQIQDLRVINAWNKSRNIWRYFETLTKVIRIKSKQDVKHWLINFRGHDYYWPLRLILGRQSVTIFDQFVSPYDSFVFERKKTSPNSLLAKSLYFIEKSILKDSNFLITDTETHAKYFATLFKIPLEKFFVVNMSVDEEIFFPLANPKEFHFKEPFIIFTYATFLPLHGMMTIAKAANTLKNFPFKFIIAGGKGKALREFISYLKLNNVSNVLHIPWIELNELPSYICGSDLCLGGPFGGTPQAERLITGKALQFLACERPTVIGKNSETKYFEDRKNCLLVKRNDHNDLADAIHWAYINRSKLQTISILGKKTYEQRYSTRIIRNQIKTLINSIQ